MIFVTGNHKFTRKYNIWYNDDSPIVTDNIMKYHDNVDIPIYCHDWFADFPFQQRGRTMFRRIHDAPGTGPHRSNRLLLSFELWNCETMDPHGPKSYQNNSTPQEFAGKNM